MKKLLALIGILGQIEVYSMTYAKAYADSKLGRLTPPPPYEENGQPLPLAPLGPLDLERAGQYLLLSEITSDSPLIMYAVAQRLMQENSGLQAPQILIVTLLLAVEALKARESQSAACLLAAVVDRSRLFNNTEEKDTYTQQLRIRSQAQACDFEGTALGDLVRDVPRKRSFEQSVAMGDRWYKGAHSAEKDELRALAAYMILSLRYPTEPLPYSRLGQLFSQGKNNLIVPQNRLAIHYHHKALTLAPHNPAALLNLADLYYSNNELKAALGFYKEALRADASGFGGEKLSEEDCTWATEKVALLAPVDERSCCITM